MKKTAIFGNWLTEYTVKDGGRITRLAFDDFDLLTTAPPLFKPPLQDYGAYETRPVYGYDDCFPSVDRGPYPNHDWMIPDHGELCWLEWDVVCRPDKLTFSVKSEKLPIVFQRSMLFKKSSLTWEFKVINNGERKYPFQHVMHPLLPLNQIRKIHFPDFDNIWSEDEKSFIVEDPDSLSKMLINSREKDVYMLYLQSVKNGLVSWEYQNGLSIRMNYPANIFPTLGVWWNHAGYPGEAGCQRNECAFEPIAGQRSSLSESFKNNLCQFVDGQSEESWEVTWSVSGREV